MDVGDKGFTTVIYASPPAYRIMSSGLIKIEIMEIIVVLGIFLM